MSSDGQEGALLAARATDESESSANLRAMPSGRASLEDGASSFAALFSGVPPSQGGATAAPSAFASAMARRDSGSSLVSSRLDDLGLNLDLPGLQVWSTLCSTL